MAVARQFTRRTAVVAGVLGAAALAAVAARTYASDHQDTPFVEFNQRFDVNDVYAFPSPREGRVVLVLGTSSPLTPAGTPTAAFGSKSEVLYQLKIDNTGDAREDLVFQFTFTGPAHNQKIRVQGPASPNQVGTTNTLLGGKKELMGNTGQVLGSPNGLQVFAGARDDPFFIDLEAFFRILPDRKPEAGPLSTITQGAFTFRSPGAAVDYLKGINDLAIVVELPLTELTANGAHPKFGVWGTTSKARIAR
ncbi:MAG TPA: DUF4331 family protein [Gemmatimonadaceae bacterium]|nr:DUF4331 family protein [Gemmatimonadaceae bacterium]